MPLRLRPLRIEDEAEARSAQDELARDDFAFLLGFEPGMSWAAYLEKRERDRLGVDIEPGWVPSTFLVADTGGELAGRISIRHELNEFLANLGGHIGYGVRPAFRRRGHATEILRQGLVIARSLGIDDVLVTCDEGNIGSMTVIETLGGVLEDVRPHPGEAPKRRYWFT